jgi:hypothetical protein
VDADYNLFYNYDVIIAGGSNSTGTNNLTSDPNFSNADYELNAGSPAIDSGAPPALYPGLPLIDFLGVARPQGAGFDRGAYEK